MLGQCGPLLSFLRNHCYRLALICFLSFQVFWLQIRLFGLLTLIATAAIWFPARCAILQQKLLILHFLYFRFCLARFLSFAWCFRWRSHNLAKKRGTDQKIRRGCKLSYFSHLRRIRTISRLVINSIYSLKHGISAFPAFISFSLPLARIDPLYPLKKLFLLTLALLLVKLSNLVYAIVKLI